MEGVLGLFKTVVESKCRGKILKNYLSSCSEHLAFSKTSGTSSLIGIINNKLNEPSTRFEGLVLLQAFLPQCGHNILADNATTWMSLSLKAVTTNSTSALGFSVLKNLFQRTVEVPELTKHVASTVVPRLVELIHLGVSPQSLLPALECLEMCMDHYNGACGPHKRAIEGFLIDIVDYKGSQAAHIFRQAGRCMALVPKLGGGGTGGALYRCAWATQHQALSRTLHNLMDELFSSIQELQTTLPGSNVDAYEPLALPDLAETDVVQVAQCLAARLSAVSTFLQFMLLSRFPVPKNISVSVILAVICRGLAVTVSSLKCSTTSHTLALAAVLPNIHVSMLRLLDALIVVCGSNLYPYSGLICRLIVQVLKWTQVDKDKWTYGTEKPFRVLRIQAYGTLARWCGVAKFGSTVEDVADQLLEMAVSDFYTERNRVLLAETKRSKHLNRKQAKRKTVVEEISMNVNGAIMQEASVAPVSKTANEAVCVAALRAVRAILASACTFIKPTAHKMLQEAVVGILIRVASGNPTVPIPYSAAGPRLELYHLLLALVLDSHSVWPPPCNLALRLFAGGLHDKDTQISTLCTQAMACVEKIVHPAFGSMHFQVPLDEVLSNVKGPSAIRSEKKVIQSSDEEMQVDTGDDDDGNEGDEESEKQECVAHAEKSFKHYKDAGRETPVVEVSNTRSYAVSKLSVSTGSLPDPWSDMKGMDGTCTVLGNGGKREKSASRKSLDSVKEMIENSRKVVRKSGSSESLKDLTIANDYLKFLKKADGLFPEDVMTELLHIKGKLEKMRMNNKSSLTEDDVDSQCSTVSTPNTCVLKKTTVGENLIDLAESNSDRNCSEDEVEQVPIEIDLADSDDGGRKKNCNVKESIAEEEKMSEKEEVKVTSKGHEVVTQAKPASAVSEVPLSSEDIPISVGKSLQETSPPTEKNEDSICTEMALNHGKKSPAVELGVQEKQNSESHPVEERDPTPPRVLRSRTISNSSASSPQSKIFLNKGSELTSVEENSSPYGKRLVIGDSGEGYESTSKKARLEAEECGGKESDYDSSEKYQDSGEDSLDESEMLSAFVDVTNDDLM